MKNGSKIVKKHYNTVDKNAWRDEVLSAKPLWVPCPNCKQKTKTKVYENTVLLNFPLYCQKCKTETIVNIVKLKMTLSDEPDA